MKAVNVHDAKTNLSSILSDIEKGESFLICRNGKPIADLIPHKKRKRTQLHPHLSKLVINYNPTEELTAEEWGEIK